MQKEYPYKFPLTDACQIIVFLGRQNCKYGIFDKSSLVHDGHYSVTGFMRTSVKDMSLVTKLDENKCIKIFTNAGIEAPYLDYENTTKTLDSAFDSFQSYLRSQGLEFDITLINVLIPKASKKLNGNKFLLDFNMVNETFKSFVDMPLEVYMSNITQKSKSIKFSVYIPKYIYNKCLQDPDLNARPTLDYVEADTISTLLSKAFEYSSQAQKVWRDEVAAEKSKKYLFINFASKEMPTRDSLVHAYIGQEITTKFNFFVGYKTDNGKYFTYKKYQFGDGSTDKGVKGVIDTEAQRYRQPLMNNPQGVAIEWTQEREDFLYQLENSFRTLSDRLNMFLSNIDDKKIEELMSNTNFKLLGA